MIRTLCECWPLVWRRLSALPLFDANGYRRRLPLRLPTTLFPRWRKAGSAAPQGGRTWLFGVPGAATNLPQDSHVNSSHETTTNAAAVAASRASARSARPATLHLISALLEMLACMPCVKLAEGSLCQRDRHRSGHCMCTRRDREPFPPVAHLSVATLHLPRRGKICSSTDDWTQGTRCHLPLAASLPLAARLLRGGLPGRDLVGKLGTVAEPL